MFIRGETISAHSARPRKIPGWIVVTTKFSPLAQYGHLILSKINGPLKVYNEEHQELPLGKNDARCHMKKDANYWAGARLSFEENTFL